MIPKLKLTETRKKKSISQTDIAELCNMDQTTYSKKERGISPVHITEWEKFANALKVNIEDIQENDSDMIINENFTFNDHATNNNINTQVNYINMPQEAWNVMLKYVEILETKIKETI